MTDATPRDIVVEVQPPVVAEAQEHESTSLKPLLVADISRLRTGGTKQIQWAVMSSDADKEAAGAQSEAAARKADEGARSGTRIPSAKALRHHWPTLLRLFELILAIFCVGLIVDPVNKARFPQNNMHHVAVIYTAFAGYTIITGVIVLGQLCGERLGWRMSIAFSLIGAIVFTAAGGVIISDWTKYMYNHIFHPSKQYMDMMCSAGVFAIFGAIVFIVDAILTFRSDADM